LVICQFCAPPAIRRPGELYENAKTLHRPYRIVPRDHRVVCSGAKRREFARFIPPFGWQLRDPLRARIGLSMHSPWMFLCETLTVTTGPQGWNKNVRTVECMNHELQPRYSRGLSFIRSESHSSDSFVEHASLVATYIKVQGMTSSQSRHTGSSMGLRPDSGWQRAGTGTKLLTTAHSYPTISTQ
jgi:hypothetical protein